MQCEIGQNINIAICTRSSAPSRESAAIASSSVCLHFATSPKLCDHLAKTYLTIWGSYTTEFLDHSG